MSTLNEVEAAHLKLTEAAQRGLGRIQAQESAAVDAQSQLAGVEADVAMLTLVSGALQQLLRSVSAESLQAVEQLETYGLRTIFQDQPLSFRMEVETKRGIQWLTPKLTMGEVEAPILDAFGGGPATVVAFLLRVLVCRRLNLAPVILLDEPFSMVSAEYIGGVAKLLRELCDKFGITILMVTHERGFIEHAHHAFEAHETSGGTVFKAVGHTDTAA